MVAKKEGPSPAPGTEGAPLPGAETGEGEAEPERVLVCASCGHLITRARHRTDWDGRHEHTRINPVGMLFHLGLFSAAEGCTVEGPPVMEDTWFPAHAWEVARCAHCAVHLGWRFRGPSHFFGLILDRLRAAD